MTARAPAELARVRYLVDDVLSGPKSSAARVMPDGATPAPGGWNRIQLVVEDISAEVERLRAAGVGSRNDIISGPGGQQLPLQDPSRDLVELFQPAPRAANG
jgi:hypothetical protein